MRTPSAAPILRRLLAARGMTRYATFLLQQEGKMLPGEVEALSGFVLDETGSVHGFWLGWDATTEEYCLEPWYPVPAPHAEFGDDPAYRRARRTLGLQR